MGRSSHGLVSGQSRTDQSLLTIVGRSSDTSRLSKPQTGTMLLASMAVGVFVGLDTCLTLILADTPMDPEFEILPMLAG